MGARPLARLIQDKIKRPLSEEILFGKLEDGGHVTLKIKVGEIVFDITSKARETESVSSGEKRAD
jgi:ATP-dependent Clp protease ATP-binding subunit ClpA